MFRFEKIHAWEKAMSWVQAMYKVTATFPDHEQFGLTAQLRRAAVSVPSNIAEGSSRSSQADVARFVEIAYGSLMEAVCQCRLATDLGYLPIEVYEKLYNEAHEIAQMLSGLRAYLEGRDERRERRDESEEMRAKR